MKLVIVLALLLGLFFGVSFAQQNQVSIQACGDGQIIAQSSEEGKTELEFTSSESIAKCFNDLDDQMSDAGWERLKGDNNIYKSDFYRIAYSNNGQKAMLVLRQAESSYKVILDF